MSRPIILQTNLTAAREERASAGCDHLLGWERGSASQKGSAGSLRLAVLYDNTFFLFSIASERTRGRGGASESDRQRRIPFLLLYSGSRIAAMQVTVIFMCCCRGSGPWPDGPLGMFGPLHECCLYPLMAALPVSKWLKICGKP